MTSAPGSLGVCLPPASRGTGFGFGGREVSHAAFPPPPGVFCETPSTCLAQQLDFSQQLKITES